MADRQELVNILDESAVDRGFRRRGRAWFAPSDETIVVLDLQGSRYGGQHYVNIAVWLLPFGPATNPKEQHCHIRTRLTQLIPAYEVDDVDRALDIDQVMLLADRRTILADALGTIDPMIDAARSLSGLSSPDGRELLRRCLVGRGVVEVLGGTGLPITPPG